MDLTLELSMWGRNRDMSTHLGSARNAILHGSMMNIKLTTYRTVRFSHHLTACLSIFQTNIFPLFARARICKHLMSLGINSASLFVISAYKC